MILQLLTAVVLSLGPDVALPSGDPLYAVSNDGCLISQPLDRAACLSDWGPGDPGLGIVLYRNVRADPADWQEDGTI